MSDHDTQGISYAELVDLFRDPCGEWDKMVKAMELNAAMNSAAWSETPYERKVAAKQAAAKADIDELGRCRDALHKDLVEIHEA